MSKASSEVASAPPAAALAPPSARTARARGLAQRWQARARSLTVRRTGELVAVVALTLWAVHAHTRDLEARLWIDEAISLGIAQHPLTAIPGVLRQDGAPPLFYVILHAWVGLFGATPRAGHVLTLGIAAAAAPAAWWAARAPFGAAAGVAAAAIVALDPFAGTYAIEIRMYSLLLLTGLLATGALLRAFVLHPGHRGWAAATAVALAAVLYTHNWGLFFAAAAGVVWLGLLAAARGGRRALLLSGAIAFGGALLLWIPWIPTVLAQTAHTGAPWSHAPNWTSVQNAGERVLGGDVAETVLLLFALTGALRLVRVADPRVVRALAVAAVLAVGTFALAFVWSNVASPAWALRYMAIVLAPAAVLIGATLARLGVVALVVLAVVFLGSWYGSPTHASLQGKSNVNVIERELGDRLPAGTRVYSTQPEQVATLRYYLGPHLRYITPLGRVHDPRVVDWRDAMQRLNRPAAEHRFATVLRRMRRGDRLLLVQPRFGETSAPWTIRIRALSATVREELHAAEPAVRVIGRVLPHRGYSRSTVSALLIERTGRPLPG